MSDSLLIRSSAPPARFIESPYLVPFDGRFELSSFSTSPPKDGKDERKLEKGLADNVKRIAEIQEKIYAQGQYAVVWTFQAMDAAGKDGTIKATMAGINPAGINVVGFKAPSHEELAHDFLWRANAALPKRGHITANSRSAYEEMLVVRVHPELLSTQNIPDLPKDLNQIFIDRFQSMLDWEAHLARNGYVLAKFFLHVSPKEQAKRLLARLTDPQKRWKFNPRDLDERKLWEKYQDAYREVLRLTSRAWAPWYVIPADNKDFMRHAVSAIQRQTLENLPLHFTEINSSEDTNLEKYEQALKKELSNY